MSTAVARRWSRVLCRLLLLAAFAGHAQAEPTRKAIAAFDAYVRRVEARLAEQHRSAGHFLAGELNAENRQRLRGGELLVDRVADKSAEELPKALLHHWRGTAFAPGASAADFEQLMRNLPAFPQVYAPQVLTGRVLQRDGEHMLETMRLQQKHFLSVVLDLTSDSNFYHLDPQHAYSISHSTQVREIAEPGTSSEHPMGPDEEHGYLWRLNAYWTVEEADGGLYMQLESVSLTRSIPVGLGWLVRPFTDSIPRESMEFTLGSTRRALAKR